MTERQLVFEDHFDGPTLDPAVWVPNYLPQWSSRAATAAQYELADSCLRLFIPPGQALWCEDDHTPRMRVSGIQSGNFSGPAGSTIGQQPYREGLLVREEQKPFWGWTPTGGYIELRARAVVSPRSMVALWMVGLEDTPERCAEICITEMFGKSVVAGESVEVGMGLHTFRDPTVPEDFAAPRLPLDPTDFHLYAADWSPDQVDFYVDDVLIRTCPNPPSYPLQLMLAVFDFPDDGPLDDRVPEFVIDYIRGYSQR
ncbi:glycoside hydrolase family 16 protein [Streptomyces sp. SID13031]|uniref:glycoside hydrolase family 16 protein n=1 Tax=Streptomyces sp. SID13031 TaxID=2706046 RepID=UPI0013C8556B|nr:glycoside hydrolase family 16 protein [Streptomyces sp. SID13031]NEA33083.1 glycoside hydrolase family 16 protein [Streptomyces sp. SID13031]